MGRLYGLDALRGIAAVLVLIGHTSLQMGTTFGKLYLAVDFFFMLSGYVMARTYEPRMAGNGRWKFLRARLWRLWPLMAFGTLLGLPLVEPDRYGAFFLGLLLVPSFATYMLYPFNGPAWSILFEFFANLVHALGIDRLKTLHVLCLSGAAWGVLTVIAWNADETNFGQISVMWWGGIPRVLFAYFFGVALYRVWQDRPPFRLPAAVTLLAMPAILLPPVDWWGADLLFGLIVCPLLIAGGLALDAGNLGKWAGAMSFPLYAIHIPVRNLYIEAGLHWIPGMMLTLAFVALIVAVPYSMNRMKPFFPVP